MSPEPPTDFQLEVSASTASTLQARANHPGSDEGKAMDPTPSKSPMVAKRPR